MATREVLILAAGPWSENPIPEDLVAQAHLILAADGGWAQAVARGIRVDRVVGDLDSLRDDEIALLRQSGTPTDVHPREKDRTDLEIAVDEALRLSPDRVVIYGAVGGRIDQTLANIFLLEKLAGAGVEGELRTPEERLFVAQGERTLTPAAVGDGVSLLSLTDRVEGVTTWGLRYALSGAALERASTRGVSNEVESLPAGVRVGTGTLLVVLRCAGGRQGLGRIAA